MFGKNSGRLRHQRAVSSSYKGGTRIWHGGVRSNASLLLDARYSFGYSSWDKSSPASGMGTVAVTVVPP
jgi:hypothetical protein